MDAAEARGEALLARVARRVARIRQHFYEIGACLKEVRDHRLFVALGYRTFDEMLARRPLVGRTQAYKLMAIVEHVSRNKAVELGEEKAYALARFVVTVPNADAVDTIVEKGIVVGRSHKRVEAMTVAEIQRAQRRVTGIRKSRMPGGVVARKRAREAELLLRERGIDASIRVVRREKQWWAQLEVRAHELPLLTSMGVVESAA